MANCTQRQAARDEAWLVVDLGDNGSIIPTEKAMTRRDAFRIGDRVELMLFCSLVGEPPPQGTVVAIGYRTVNCKMDRNGKVVRFEPSDLRVIPRPKGKPR